MLCSQGEAILTEIDEILAFLNTIEIKSLESAKKEVETNKELKPLCCYYFSRGFCDPPRPPCKFRHGVDDGITPCGFGNKCRQGHAKRAPKPNWSEYNRDGGKVGHSPAVRDANLLRSQLEPFQTGRLRTRLVEHFGGQYSELDDLHRRDVMKLLLSEYKKKGPRILVRREGVLVRPDLRASILHELEKWANGFGDTNHRPSINAKSYTILRTSEEFGNPNSRKAKLAARKLEKHKVLFDFAMTVVKECAPDFKVSAIALTKGFTGSPHIDKQNTGPFCGLSLGSFPDGEGGIRVEARYDVVVEANSKNRLARVDGRYPHWVAPYSSGDRYSIIYYETTAQYKKPGTAVWPPLNEQEIIDSVETC